MEYQVIPDFLYLNEPIYRRVDGVPQARLVSSVLSVNAEPIDNNQHGVYPWSAAAGPAASEPDLFTRIANSAPTNNWRNRGTISSADGEHLVRVGYRAEDLQSVLAPANANRVYYRQRLGREFLRLGTLVRHFLRSGDRDMQTQFFFSDEPDRSYPVSSLFYDPLPDVPTTAPVIGLPTQGGYKRSSTTTTSRNKKKKQKLIRRTAASRSRKRRSSTTKQIS